MLFRLCETFFRKFFKCLQSVPFHFLFCKRMDVHKTPKDPPFQFFRLWGFFRKKTSGAVEEYFDTLKSFCYFWALDMASTWAGPGLLNLVFQTCCISNVRACVMWCVWFLQQPRDGECAQLQWEQCSAPGGYAGPPRRVPGADWEWGGDRSHQRQEPQCHQRGQGRPALQPQRLPAAADGPQTAPNTPTPSSFY